MESILSSLKFLFKYRIKLVDQIMFYLSMICALTVVVHVGYITDATIATSTEKAVIYMFYFLFILQTISSCSSIFAQRQVNIAHIGGLVILGYFFLIAFARLSVWEYMSYLSKDEWLYLGIALMFLSELSKNSLFFDNFYFNPTILFVLSFIALILLWTILYIMTRTTMLEPFSFVEGL